MRTLPVVMGVTACIMLWVSAGFLSAAGVFLALWANNLSEEQRWEDRRRCP